MDAGSANPSQLDTPVLLVEADLDARSRHEVMLTAAGYSVLAVAACPQPSELHEAAVVLSDIPSFHWLQDQQARRLPPIVALADDVKAGVSACLCGAAAWIPTDAERAYVLDTVEGVLRPPQPPRR